MSAPRRRAGDDAVRAFLRERGAAEHVVAGGIEGLVAAWERTASAVAVGYEDDLDEYRNDLDARRWIDETLAELPNAASAELLTRIEAADELFRAHVELGPRCVWGVAIARRERWSRKRQWWYFARPLRCGEELASALAPRRGGTA
ncbi:MAG: hypothetical protein IPJ77_09390 [Planctomycetes bacterium]|nr:hypothetical protein [Planctomycetota bacterium]